MEQEKLNRLYCNCVFSDTFTEIKAALKSFELSQANAKYKESVKHVHTLLENFKEIHEKHLQKYNFDVLRSMLELKKFESINSNTDPVQTNAWKPGDLKRLRLPPKKKSKKEEAFQRKKIKIANTQSKTKKLKEKGKL